MSTNQNKGFGPCPTVRIEGPGGKPVRINEEDFNDEIHERHTEKEEMPEPTSREELIGEAIGRMDKEDEEQWLKDGRPDLEILRDEADIQDITDPERNAAWISLQEVE